MNEPMDPDEQRARLNRSGFLKPLGFGRNRRNRVGGKSKVNQEEGWAKRDQRRHDSIWILLGVGGLGIAILAVLFVIFQDDWFGGGESNAAPPGRGTMVTDNIPRQIEMADAVTRSFLKTSDPEERLKWVRNPELVRKRLHRYPTTAVSTPGKIDEMIGHVDRDGQTVTAFVAALADGDMRLIELLATDDGPRIDWDAYARYGTATWEELWSGRVKHATVRVFCQPGTEHPQPFEDRAAWTCFQISSPDMPQAALGFVSKDTVRDRGMQSMVLQSPNYRQRFTLEITRHDGRGEPVFEITRCVAVGWIVSDPVIEDTWQQQAIEQPRRHYE